ncbi:Twin-arginine translocation protein TatA [gamma proteobacterium IMCC2047]|nr:Twin-arginine translocation protein TatA [gamma proteobacterium IMCC2047]
MLFGTKRLKGIGGDLGTAIKGFRKTINSDDTQEVIKQDETPEKNIEGDK